MAKEISIHSSSQRNKSETEIIENEAEKLLISVKYGFKEEFSALLSFLSALILAKLAGIGLRLSLEGLL